MIEQALIIAFIVNAINVCFWEGHLLQKIGDYMEVKYPTLWKPLGGCVICMTPWYGSIIAILAGYNWLSVFIAMGINVVIVRWEPKD